MKKGKKVCLLVVGTFLAVIIIMYLGASFYYQNRFLPHTTINNQDFSNMNPDEVEEILSDDILSYTLTVIDQDGNREHIMPTDYKLTYVSSGEIQDIEEKQNPFLWFLSLFNSKEYTVKIETTYDTNLLNELISQLSVFENQTVVNPQDAYINFVDGRYVIVEEIYGNQLDSDKIYQEIIAAVDAKVTELDLTKYEVFDAPAITSDNEELNAELTRLNTIADLKITFPFGSQERVLEGSTIRDWISLAEDGTITVSTVHVDDYVLSLAKEFNTFGSTRTINSTLRGSIDIVGGDYGWVMDKEATAAALIEVIKDGESQTLEPIYSATAATHDGVDTGEPTTYVEIDLSAQHLWYYENGVLKVESDIVSGKKGDNQTREGTFAIMFKKQDTPLIGETWNVPVAYFMPFYTNVGLHDASSFRKTFGGNIWETNGSHGCINMPLEKAEEIYQTIKVGTIVYTYY